MLGQGGGGPVDSTVPGPCPLASPPSVTPRASLLSLSAGEDPEAQTGQLARATRMFPPSNSMLCH